MTLRRTGLMKSDVNRSRQIACALLVDAVLGDPRSLPHPARVTGRVAECFKLVARRYVKDEKLAGLLTAVAVAGLAASAGAAVTGGARRLHPRAGDVAAVLVFWTTFAARDLADHALAVHAALERGDLPAARELVGRMVGREVNTLDEPGVVRAAVESVAENTVDGVTAPLFYAWLGGPTAAAAYKAINTLDSMFGYRDSRYIRFGWASARADDLVNLLPARLTVGATAVAAALVGRRPTEVVRVCLRDGRRHSSPNSGLAEAAVAGALGVQLGGPLKKGGRVLVYPTLGDPRRSLDRGKIKEAVHLMAVTTGVWAGLLLGGSALLRRCFGRRQG